MDNKLPGIDGGAWSEDTHLSLHPENFNHGLARYIVDVIKPASVLEFGSGLGYLSRYIVEESGVNEVVCIEPGCIKGVYNEINGPRLLQIDIFTDTHPDIIKRQYDLVISIEVAEHIERSRHEYLFDFLVDRSSNWIVFSGARIGQGGHGHIAERNEKDWMSEFTSRGMIFEKLFTRDIREACDKKNINHRRNLMVFRK